LKPSNVKATAKKRLLAELDAGTLEVPNRILQIEEELKMLYHEANEVAEEKYYKEKEEQDKGEEGQDKGEASESESIDELQSAEVAFEEITGASSFKQSCKLIEQGKRERLKVGDYTGCFEVSCPTVVSEWPDHCDSDSLTLELGVHGKALWGKYDLGMFSGIILFSRIPTVSNEFVPCSWRGRENGEGEMSFGEYCTGTIAFLPNRKLAGTLSVYGDLAFAGTGWGSKVSSEEVKSWKNEWEEFNDDRYEYERRARWG